MGGDPVPRRRDVPRNDVATISHPAVLDCSHYAAADSHVGVEYFVAGVGQGKDQPLDQFHGKLTRMIGLLDVVIFDVRENPNVAGILSQRITRELAGLRSLEVLFTRIFRWNANGVQIELVVILGEPKDCLMPPGKPLLAMQPVLEMPDDPVPEFQFVFFEQGIENRVERDDLALVNMVADLPANRPARA